MVKSRIYEYINSIKDNKRKLIEFKNAIGRYELLADQFGQNFLEEAIEEVKKAKGKEGLSNLDVFLAYEDEIDDEKSEGRHL